MRVRPPSILLGWFRLSLRLATIALLGAVGWWTAAVFLGLLRLPIVRSNEGGPPSDSGARELTSLRPDTGSWWIDVGPLAISMELTTEDEVKTFWSRMPAARQPFGNVDGLESSLLELARRWDPSPTCERGQMIYVYAENGMRAELGTVRTSNTERIAWGRASFPCDIDHWLVAETRPSEVKVHATRSSLLPPLTEAQRLASRYDAVGTLCGELVCADEPFARLAAGWSLAGCRMTPAHPVASSTMRELTCIYDDRTIDVMVWESLSKDRTVAILTQRSPSSSLSRAPHLEQQ